MVDIENATKSLIVGGAEDLNVEPAISVEEYEKLLDQYNSNLTEGEVVKGKVLQVSDSEVVVDVGYKSEGMIALEEFRNEEGNINVQAGDTVDVLLEKTEDKNGSSSISGKSREDESLGSDRRGISVTTYH